MIKLSNFIWSTKEQVYPFEKASDGSILYAKEIDCGELPNNGTKQVAHSISGLDITKVFKWYMTSATSTDCFSTHYADDGGGSGAPHITGWLNSTQITLVTRTNRTGGYCKCRIIYSK